MPDQPFAGRLRITKDGGHALYTALPMFCIAEHQNRPPEEAIDICTQQTLTNSRIRTQFKPARKQ